jgi:hypothetical protein
LSSEKELKELKYPLLPRYPVRNAGAFTESIQVIEIPLIISDKSVLAGIFRRLFNFCYGLFD